MNSIAGNRYLTVMGWINFNAFVDTGIMSKRICEGDFDGDCDVDGSDLAVFTSDFGRSNCPFCPNK